MGSSQSSPATRLSSSNNNSHNDEDDDNDGNTPDRRRISTDIRSNSLRRLIPISRSNTSSSNNNNNSLLHRNSFLMSNNNNQQQQQQEHHSTAVVLEHSPSPPLQPLVPDSCALDVECNLENLVCASIVSYHSTSVNNTKEEEEDIRSETKREDQLLTDRPENCIAEDNKHETVVHHHEPDPRQLHTPPPSSSSPSLSSTWIPPVYTPVVRTVGDYEYNVDKYQPELPPPSDESNINGWNSNLFGHVREEVTNHGEGYGFGPDGEVYYLTPPSQFSQPPDFLPQGSRHYEWMGRSLETLLLGYGSIVPILCLPEDAEEGDEDTTHVWGTTLRRRSTVSTVGSSEHYCYYGGPRSSLGSSGPGYRRRRSLVGNTSSATSNTRRMHGGTTANYFNHRRRGSSGRRDSTSSNGGVGRRGSMTSMPIRRGSASHGPSYHRRRTSMRRSNSSDSEDAHLNQLTGSNTGGEKTGPNIVLSLLARESTGKRNKINHIPFSTALKFMGGKTLFDKLDRPGGGMCSEVTFLSEVIDSGDWVETQTIISRISYRLMGDPSMASHHTSTEQPRQPAPDDPSLPPNASRFYAGGGRVGLERDAFVLADGVEVLIRIFRENSFVGAEMAESYDARDLSEELVSSRLATCWNETLACLRELIYAIPSLVKDDIISDHGDFLPFLFTLLSHDSCFESAAVLIEEILSLQSHSPVPTEEEEDDDDGDDDDAYWNDDENCSSAIGPRVRVPPNRTFFLGNVSNLYSLWSGFSCRQLAHFCRILALLVFEPEDRQLLESPSVLRSVELLELRRNRAARAGKDATVDMNQSILLGDERLFQRFLQLLGVMNYAPPVRRSSSYHIMTHHPFIAEMLGMLGLKELNNWNEVARLDKLARTLSTQSGDDNVQGSTNPSGLGSVAEMLESISRMMAGTEAEQNNQLRQIMHVISAAQQAGVVIVGDRSRQAPDSNSNHAERTESTGIDDSDPHDELQELSTTIGVMTDQVRARRDEDIITRLTGRSGRTYTATEASNILQFNALLLSAYQVEVLFVLCTLLGGRRKIDAQEMLKRNGMIPILEDTFERLPWDSLSPSRERISNHTIPDEQPTGIHGPGCECTPESALCVQYLRLLHNFCDRDCDNYDGRRLLLSSDERKAIFEHPLSQEYDISKLKPGLLSKIIAAFTCESDESTYRFWLASCVESYLRGSSAAEQVFVVKTGLLRYLMDEITSQRLHCAGSLQTSFDLLGELCKGNTEVLNLMVQMLDEERFRKLMGVAAINLVDSNVFIRSVLLSLERISASNHLLPLHYLDTEQSIEQQWKSTNGPFSRGYLTHSWWDTHLLSRPASQGNSNDDDSVGRPQSEESERLVDCSRPSDWYPTIGALEAYGTRPPKIQEYPTDNNLGDSKVGPFGWVFAPECGGDRVVGGWSPAVHAPNTLERLSWFINANQTRLLLDLLSVVDLQNVNHENICCLNTAVVICIFAYRRQQLDVLLQDLKRMNEEEDEHQRRAVNASAAAAAAAVKDDNTAMDRAFFQAMKYMTLDVENPPARYARRASLPRRSSLSWSNSNNNNNGGGLGVQEPLSAAGDDAAATGCARSAGCTGDNDRKDVMRNFREVLWFWMEYYTHRGRDRLSLEFSSHLRFQEFREVVLLLGADNGSPTSLLPSPLPLPKSPYQRAA